MRRVTAMLCPLVMAFALLAATPASAATPADTLVIAKNIDDIISLDPAEAYEASAGEIITNVYDRLIRFEADDLSRLVGGVAETWTVSPDGHVFTFKLRPGLQFQSGNPITSADVAFSLARVVRLDLTPAFLLAQFGWTKDNLGTVIATPDAATVVLTVPESLAPSLVLNILSSTIGAVVDKAVAMSHETNGDTGHDWLKTHAAASGAFELRSWKADESVVLEASPRYRLGAPGVHRVIVRHVADPLAQRLMLQKGDVDIARDLPADQTRALAGDSGIAVTEVPSVDSYYVALNQSDARLADARVRDALRLLIDYQGMVAGPLKGQFVVSQTILPQGIWSALPDTPYRLDIAKAKALLAEAGYPNGFTVTLDAPSAPPWTEIAQALQATMGQAGIKVEIISEEQKQVWTRYRARQHQMLLIIWSPDYLDPHSNAEAFVRNIDNGDTSKVRTPAWRNHWRDPPLVEAVDKAVAERDTEKRKAIYEALQRDVMARGPYLVMFQPVVLVAARSTVKGFVVGPYWDLVFYRKVTK